MSLGKTFKAIHYTFMSAYNQLKIIVVAEFHDTIRLQYQTLWDDIEHKWIYDTNSPHSAFQVLQNIITHGQWISNMSCMTIIDYILDLDCHTLKQFLNNVLETTIPLLKGNCYWNGVAGSLGLFLGAWVSKPTEININYSSVKTTIVEPKKI